MGALYRHEPVCGSYCDGPRMEYRADGDWVRVEDFEAAEKQRDEARAEVERLHEAAWKILSLAGAVCRWPDVADAVAVAQKIHKITEGMVE